jgi:peptidyl-prolyl cis-trans isomerase C
LHRHHTGYGKLGRVKLTLGYRSRIVAAVLVVVLLPVLVVGLTVLVAVWTTRLPDDVALRVDGVDITRAEAAKHANVLTLLYGTQAPRDPAGFDRYRRDAAQAMALGKIMDRAAVQMGLGVDDRGIADALNRITANGGALGPQKFEAAKLATGVNQQDLLDEVKRQNLSQQLYQKVIDQSGAQGPVSDEDVQRFFDEHRAEMVRAETRHLRNIVLANKADADRVLAEARGGADFADLARRYSLDPTTKANGGELGVLNRAPLEDAYADAAFAAPPNSLFGPVQSPNGWNVGQVLEVQPQVPLNFPDVAQALRGEVVQDRIDQAWRDWVRQRFAEEHVEYGDDYRPVDPNFIPLPPPLPTAG